MTALASKVFNMDDRLTDGPQVENGFVRIANELEDAILLKIRTFRHSQVVRAIIRKTYGYGKKEDDISLSQISEMTGLHRSHVSVALRNLERMRIINPIRPGKFGQVLGLNKHHVQWLNDVAVSETVTETATGDRVTETVQNGYQNSNSAVTDSAQNHNQNGNHKRQLQKTTPKDNSKRKGAIETIASAKPDGFGAVEMVASLPSLSESVAADYVKFRKSIKKPLNATAWGAIAKQVVLSGWTPDDALAEAMAAGWQGVKADWLANRTGRSRNTSQRLGPTAENFAAKDYGQGGLL